MNDRIAEGPHAAFKRESARTRSSSFVWNSASVRLKQNCADFHELCEQTDRDEQAAWNAAPSCIFNQRNPLKPCRMKPGTAYSRVYDICSHPHFAHGKSDAMALPPALMPDDGGEGPGHDHPALFDGDGPVRAPKRVAVNPEMDRLMLDFLDGTLEQFQYFSVPSAEGLDEPIWVYQLLNKGSRDIVVKTYEESTCTKHNWQVVRMELVVSPDNSNTQNNLGDSCRVYEFYDAAWLDVVDLFGGDMEQRRHWRVWTAAECEASATYRLSDPKRLVWGMPWGRNNVSNSPTRTKKQIQRWILQVVCKFVLLIFNRAFGSFPAF